MAFREHMAVLGFLLGMIALGILLGFPFGHRWRGAAIGGGLAILAVAAAAAFWGLASINDHVEEE